MSEERPKEAVSRRAVGWLLLLGSPGLVAGAYLTLWSAPFGLRRGTPAVAEASVALGLWALAASMSAVGGHFALPQAARVQVRVLFAIAAFVFGAAAFLATLASFDYLT